MEVSQPVYSPMHMCWPKTSLAGNQGNHQNFAPSGLATQEPGPLTAFHGIQQFFFIIEEKGPARMGQILMITLVSSL